MNFFPFLLFPVIIALLYGAILIIGTLVISCLVGVFKLSDIIERKITKSTDKTIITATKKGVKLIHEILRCEIFLPYPPSKQFIYLGRPGGDVPVDVDFSPLPRSDTISRNHAVLIFNSDFRVLIQDLNSTNGTFINNYKIPPFTPILLSRGNRIRFGPYHSFLFEEV